MSAEAKRAEAASLVKSAKKRTSKSMFKWSIDREDWDSAASEYGKAAKIYTHIGDVPGATDAFHAAVECHAKCEQSFYAGKALETLATFLKDQGKAEEVGQLYYKASQHYARANKIDAQAEALSRAANSAPTGSAEGIPWLEEAITLLEDNDKHHVIRPLHRTLLLQYVRAGEFLRAVELNKRYIATCQKLDTADAAAKAGLEIVILLLHMGDSVLAEREFQAMAGPETFGFPHSQEQAVGYDLVDAAEQRDQDRLTEAGKHQIIQFLTNEIARMGKKLTVPSGAPKPKKKAAAPAAAAAVEGGGDAPGVTFDGDEEEEGEEDAR